MGSVLTYFEGVEGNPTRRSDGPASNAVPTALNSRRLIPLTGVTKAFLEWGRGVLLFMIHS